MFLPVKTCLINFATYLTNQILAQKSKNLIGKVLIRPLGVRQLPDSQSVYIYQHTIIYLNFSQRTADSYADFRREATDCPQRSSANQSARTLQEQLLGILTDSPICLLI